MEIDKIQDLASKDRRHVLHPWADLNNLGTTDPLIIQKAEAVYVYDREGRKYIDAIGGMWCVNLGYGVQELADAMAQQAMQMPYYTPFGAMSNAPAAQLATTLADLAPGNLNRVHFTTGGSTAVDSALRFVQYYFNITGQPNKKYILSRLASYHGSTYLTASVSGKQWDKTHFDYEQRFIHHIPEPAPSRRAEGESIDAFRDRTVCELEEAIVRLGADNVACFIAEPIQASGGVIVPPPGYLSEARDVCRRYGVLFIADEVVTGFGRLGHFFASEPRFNVIPDLLITAKGLTSGYQPLGAVIIDDALMDAVCDHPTLTNNYFTSGYTYSGHPVACNVALKTIELMKEWDICGHVRDVGPYFIKQLHTLARYPIVGAVRGDHLMACVECKISPNNPTTTEEDIAAAQTVDRFCQEFGLLVRPYENLCILSPPLIIDKEQIDRIVELMGRAIESAQNELGIA